MMFSKGKGLVGVIDSGCEIDGKIRFNGSIRLNGKFKGEIDGQGQLFVGKGGHIDAKVDVDEMIVEGLVKGAVRTRSAMEIHKGGEVHADVTTGGMTIENGGVFRGQCTMQVAETLEMKPENIDDKEEKKSLKKWKKTANS